ncbi:MAG: hypothetical protein ACI8RZ_002077 [Myxococcota bacterium]|jgi:hypothetical protein
MEQANWLRCMAMDVVYPYKQPGHSEELRYSLRALEKYFPDHGQVWIIGERPDGLRRETYRFIPHASAPRRDPAYRAAPWPDLARLRAKERNINAKIAIAATHDAISEAFLFINDDHYLLKPTTAPQLQGQSFTRGDARDPRYATLLESHYPGDIPYKALISAALDQLIAEGKPALDFEAHVPVVLHRSRCRALLAKYGSEAMFHHPWLSLYFNTFPPSEPPVMVWLSHSEKRNHAPEAPTHKLEVRGECSARWIQSRITDDTWTMNHNWSGFSAPYARFLQDRFPDPSRYETTVADEVDLTEGGLDMPPTSDTVVLFWTGGFDSTFRLMQLLSDGISVVPVYLSVEIDARKNQAEELAAMARLTDLLRRRFPDALLHDLLLVTDLPENPWVEEQARRIGYSSSHSRPMGHQYIGLCRFAESHHVPVEIGVEIGGRAERLLRGKVRGQGGACRIDPATLASQLERALMIFHRMRFPLIHLDRPAMLAEAGSRGFIAVLSQTFSCWFPVDGVACGRCYMCKGRPVF